MFHCETVSYKNLCKLLFVVMSCLMKQGFHFLCYITHSLCNLHDWLPIILVLHKHYNPYMIPQMCSHTCPLLIWTRTMTCDIQLQQPGPSLFLGPHLIRPSPLSTPLLEPEVVIRSQNGIFKPNKKFSAHSAMAMDDKYHVLIKIRCGSW